MHYLALVFKEERSTYGVMIPDLPGCYSGGETLEEALTGAKEAIELHLESMTEDGDAIPERLPFEQHRANPEFTDGLWAVVPYDTPRATPAGG